MAKGHSVYPEDLWEKRVFEEHTWWKEYGCGFNARHKLPAKEYQAHLALIEGEHKYKQKEQKRQERKAKRSGK